MDNPQEIKIKSLRGDWADNDVIILHACFNLLEDCVDNEHLLTHSDWSIDSDSLNAKDEITALYNWWTERKKIEPGFHSEEDQIQYEKDNDMLIRLIKVRKYLWT